MMEKTNLVLNINTPNYFGVNSTQLSKRIDPADSTFQQINSYKKRKLDNGKSLKASSKHSKIKLGVSSAVSRLKDKNIEKSRIVNHFNEKESSGEPLNKKRKVSFDSDPQYISNEFPTEIPSQNFIEKSKLSSQNSKQNNANKQLNEKNSPHEREVISLLFSKCPSIPHIPKVDIPQATEEVFSTKTFQDLHITPQLISNVEKMGYSFLTMVQQLGIPPILEGKDALIKSQTGSGKTLSFALPIIHKLMTHSPKIERNQGIYALIIVPTRELAIQTYSWIEKLCKACVWVVPGYLMGGEKKKAEKNRIRKGINILIATPGRLTDHINNTNCLSMKRVRYVVLDEADRMLDMGYEQSIKSIIYALNEQNTENIRRQTVLLSATLTSAVMKLAGITLVSPQMIDISADTSTSCTASSSSMCLTSDSLVTPQNLTQYFMIVPAKLRLVTLASFILEKCKLTSDKKMLVFLPTQDMVDYHTSLFSLILSRYGRNKRGSCGINIVSRRGKVKLTEDIDQDIDEVNEKDIHFMKLHGNMTQPERTAVFKSFCDAHFGVLICTDVASRGLDLPKVNWIVQYNAASSAADYVHRVGRTARANNAGSAVVFINPSESTYITMLEKHGIKFTEMKMENILESLTNSSLYESAQNVPRNMEAAATELQFQLENAVAEDNDMHQMAVQGYVSFIRSYAAIPKESRQYFCFKLLHLGHYAKSFALRETPSVLGLKGSRSYDKSSIKNRKEEKRSKQDWEKPLMQKRPSAISEFDSGFDGIEDDSKKGEKNKKTNKSKKR